MNIEVLVATMHQKDFSKLKEMNIQSDVILANQTTENRYCEFEFQGHTAKMVSTNTCGVGINRNIALLYANADICLLADEDMCFDDGYESIVMDAFRKLPQADIIIFNLDTIGEETRNRRNNKKIHKVNFFNSLNYGAARVAFKRDSVLKANLWFSVLFGGGTSYGSGEDSLFLTSALKHGLKIYTYPKRLATVTQQKSSWFCGYNDKYFEDKGRLFYCLSRRYAKALCLQDAIRHQKSYNRSFFACYNLMRKGRNKFKK